MSRQRWTAGPRLGLGLVVTASTVLVWTTVDAVRLKPPSTTDWTLLADSTPELSPKVSSTTAQLALAVEQDPFHPERRRPTRPFRLPSEPMTNETEPAATQDALHLIGTAVFADGSGFAICQLGGQSPRLLRLGERLGEYELSSVAKGKASFLTSTGTRVEITVPKAGP